MFTHLSRSSLSLLLARLGTQLGTVLFTVLLARRLGISNLGEYAFIAALIFVGNALTTFGTDMLLIREIAARDDLSRLPSALLVQLALSILLIVPIWLWGAWIPNQTKETLLALKIYILSLVPLAFFTVFTSALRGKQRMGAYAILNLIASMIQVGVVWFPGINLTSLFVLLLLAQAMLAVIAGSLCSMVIPDFWKAWRIPWSLPFSFIKDTAPLAFLTCMTILYQRLSVMMLSLMVTPAETGLFSAAARVIEAAKTLHLAVFAALYPAMSQAQTDAANKFLWDKSFALSWKILLAGAVLISSTLYTFSTFLVGLAYGTPFTESAAILRILAWIVIPFTVNTYLTLSLLASNQERRVGQAFVAGLLGLLVLNILWIPSQGPEGCARASLMAECVQSAVLLVRSRLPLQFKGESHGISELP